VSVPTGQPTRGHRTVAWSKEAPYGVEFAEVHLREDTIDARGVAIGTDPEPYRLDYTLAGASGYLTSRVTVVTSGQGWQRQLDLRRDRMKWLATTLVRGESPLPGPGGELGALGDALDPDLGLSPLFNSIPVLRHDLHHGGVHDFLMVWISVPGLSLHASPQRYTHIESIEGRNLVRFEALGADEDFTADVEFDADALVVDYPGIARRL
jgi:hypothetical protein